MTSPEPFPQPEAEVHEAHEPDPTVPVWVPFVVMLAVFVILGTISAAVYGLVTLTDSSVESADDLPEGATIALTVIQDVVFVFGAWIAVKLVLGSATRADFGLVRVRDLGTVAKWSAIAYGGFWLVLIVLSQIFGTPDDQELVTDIKEQDSLGILICWGVLICVLAPAVEETFFRGFMFTVFLKRLGVVWAAVLVGVIFGLVHAPADPIQLIGLGAFGLGLCLLYWRAQSIIPCMALHALNNSITFGLVKDLDPALFAGVVVLSVATVVGGATALSARPAVAA